jgi:hypothetical protein
MRYLMQDKISPGSIEMRELEEGLRLLLVLVR